MVRTGTPISDAASPRLTQDQIDSLSRYGEIRETKAGQILIKAGDVSSDFLVGLEGEVEVVDNFAGEARRIALLTAGNFVGELNMLTGQALYLTFIASKDGKVLAIPRKQLKEIVSEDPALSDIILKAFLARRSMGMRFGVGLRIIGSRHSGDATRLREFATRNRLVHRWIELGEDPKAEALLERFGGTPADAPVVIWQGTEMLKNPTNAELARTIGLRVDPSRHETYDLVVVGAGPAGLGASVYGASEGLATLALESMALGGQANTSSRIENYLGFPAGLSGFELASRAMIQADKFGARTAVPQEAVGLKSKDGHFIIELLDGGRVAAHCVIVATGARYRSLNLPRLGDLEGVSIHYAATEAEAQRCEGEDVAVVGGGNSAGQAALFLAERASHVYLLIRAGGLAKTMSKYLVDRISQSTNVELLTHTEIRELIGEDRLEGIVTETNRSGVRRTLAVGALFVFIGAQANTEWLQGVVALDRSGFILTGRDLSRSALDDNHWQGLSREPYLLETSLPGLFAAGDVRSGSIKRVASAVGDGSMAVRFAHLYLSEKRR